MTPLRDFSAMTLIWMLRRCAGYLGWLPMLLILVLLCALAACLKQQSSDAEQMKLLLEKKPLAVQSETTHPADTAVNAQAEVSHTGADYLADLWQHLPEFSELSPRMMQIAQMAQNRQIALNVGEYQLQEQTDPKAQNIKQFDMRFSIHTDYATCRQFIVDVLMQYPDMALTALDLHKNETAQSELDATLVFSAFIREGRTNGH